MPKVVVKEAEEVVSVWRAGARFYLCGMRKLADGIGRREKVVTEVAKKKSNVHGVGQ